MAKDSNSSGLLLRETLSKSSDNFSPYYVDGAMLHNDAQFFLYGGLIFRMDDYYDPPPADEITLYQAYSERDDNPLWRPSFAGRELGDDVNRWVAWGGAASAPSENKAWYFSGLTSPSRGVIYTQAARNDTLAYRVSNRLITVDMSTQNDEQWSNTTIGEDVEGRASPELVWVPVGEEGILVVLGGVTYPQWAGSEVRNESDDPEASVSPHFPRL